MGLVNTDFGIFDKSGTLQVRIDATDWFKNVLPSLTGSLGVAFDPKVVYDHFQDRWVMVWLATDASTESWFLVSVSDDDDPNGIWSNWALRGDRNGSTPSGNWSDYQGLGFDSQAVYVVPNQFSFAGSFDYAKIRILPKSPLYAASCPAITWTDFWDIRFPQAGADAFAPATIRPAVTFGQPGIEYLMTNSFFISPDNNFMVVYKLTNPLAAIPSLSADIVPVTASNPPPDADQLGNGTPLIDVGGHRIRNVVYRNGSVWTAHSVASSTGQFARARYVRIDVNDLSGPTEDVSVGADTCWYYYPAITTDVNNNMVMVFNRSCATEFAGIRYSSRLDGGSLQPSVLIKAGEANYVKTFGGTRNRWGDYNGVAVDPSDPSSVWTFAEYAASPSNTWSTWFARIRFGAAILPPGLVSPADGALINTSTPLFDWDAPSTGDVVDYRLQATSGDITGGAFDIDVVISGDPLDTQFQVQLGNALPDATYTWRVIASDSSGSTASSVTREFDVDTTPPAPFTLIAPPIGALTGVRTPTFQWQASTSDDVVSSRLQVTSGGDVSGGTYDIDVLLAHPIIQFKVSSGDALADANYTWRVIAEDAATNTASSVTRTFTITTPHTVTGSVKLEGLPNPLTGAVVTAEAGTLMSQVFSDPQDGSFTIRLFPGTYDLTVAKDGFLKATRTGVVVNQNLVLPEVKLLGGNFNGDNVLDVNDLVIPAKNLGKTESPWP